MAKGKVKKIEIEDKIELEESPIQEPIVEEQKENVQEAVEIVSVENKPVNKKVVAEKQIIPKVFAPNIKVATDPNALQFYNGRAYKVIGNGYAMWCDNGTTFVISDLK